MKRKRHRHSLTIYPVAIAKKVGLLVATLLGAAYGLFLYRSDAHLLARDALITLVAHYKAGEDPYFDYDPRLLYTRNDSLHPLRTWGIRSNSMWLVDKTELIVPHMIAENITGRPRYPTLIGFSPFLAMRSFVVAGTASCNEGIVLLNDRMVLDRGPRWTGEAGALTTVVHELIHIQGGNFCNGGSVFLEGNTSAATVEVLASMCGWGDQLACKGFWQQIEASAKASVSSRLANRGLYWVYDVWASLLLRDAGDEDVADKLDLFWSLNPRERASIIEKYYRRPWDELILAGVRGIPLNTGIRSALPPVGGEPPRVFLLGMKFDDTALQLGILAWLAWVN